MKLPHGRYKDVELSRIPSWYLKWVCKSFSDKGIQSAAREVLETRSRLGIEKPKKQAKKLPLEPVTANPKRETVTFSVQNANLTGQDAF